MVTLNRRHNSENKQTGVQIGFFLFLITLLPLTATRQTGPAWGLLLYLGANVILFVPVISRAYYSRLGTRILQSILSALGYGIATFFYISSGASINLELPLMLIAATHILLLSIEYFWSTGFGYSEYELDSSNQPISSFIRRLFGKE